MSEGPYPHTQKSSGLHEHENGTVHSHRTWDEYHGHDGLPTGAGTPIGSSQEELAEAFQALRSRLVERGVHPDLAGSQARAAIEARPFA